MVQRRIEAALDPRERPPLVIEPAARHDERVVANRRRRECPPANWTERKEGGTEQAECGVRRAAQPVGRAGHAGRWCWVWTGGRRGVRSGTEGGRE
eukprot:scaffold241019_cov29-Tisochrysis_lutea.AAC.3